MVIPAFAAQLIAHLPQEALARAQVVRDFLHAAHRLRQVFSAVLGVPIEDATLQPHLTVGHGDRNVAGVELIVLAQPIAHVLANALVRADVALRPLSRVAAIVSRIARALGIAPASIARAALVAAQFAPGVPAHGAMIGLAARTTGGPARLVVL